MIKSSRENGSVNYKQHFNISETIFASFIRNITPLHDHGHKYYLDELCASHDSTVHEEKSKLNI
jgi:hypothetical protein